MHFLRRYRVINKLNGEDFGVFGRHVWSGLEEGNGGYGVWSGSGFGFVGA
jgi:hypothetical protein